MRTTSVFWTLLLGLSSLTYASGGYVGGGIGAANMDDDSGGTYNDGVGVQAFGGYMFTDNFGIQGGVVSTGAAVVGTPYDIYVSGVDVSLVAGVKASPGLFIYGRLGGLVSPRVRVLSGSTEISTTDDEKSFAPGGALGLDIGFGSRKQHNIRLEYATYTVSFDSTSDELKTSMFSVNYLFRF